MRFVRNGIVIRKSMDAIQKNGSGREAYREYRDAEIMNGDMIGCIKFENFLRFMWQDILGNMEIR